MKRVLSALRWVGPRFDAVLAFVLGVTFAVLGLFDVIEATDVLIEATLATLSVLALAVLRERSNREHLTATADALSAPIDRIGEGVAALQSGTPYRVMRYEASWDLVAEDGSLAYARKLKRLRFLQNRVISLYDYGATDGRAEDVSYTPGEWVDSFNIGAKRVDLISLRAVHQVGDELDFRVKRTLRDSFTNPTREAVTVDALDPTDLLVVTVTWPPNRKPTRTRLEHAASTDTKTREIEPDEYKETAGRTSLTVRISHPAVGDAITVVWDWEPVTDGALPPAARVVDQLSGSNQAQLNSGNSDAGAPAPEAPGSAEALRSNRRRRADDT